MQKFGIIVLFVLGYMALQYLTTASNVCSTFSHTPDKCNSDRIGG